MRKKFAEAQSLGATLSMFPEDPSWPFKFEGNQLMQFNQKTLKWNPLVGTKDASGYMLASWKSEVQNRRFMRVHQIAWITAHGSIPEGMVVRHIDGDLANNELFNLTLDITNDSPRKLLPHQVALTLAMPSNASWSLWAERWGVTKQHLLNLRSRKSVNAPLKK